MRTKLLAVSLATLLCFGFLTSAYSQADKYPNKPVQIVVPHRAGGGIDRFIRMLAEELTKTWNVSINIINKPGAGGAIAGSDVANAANDGYMVLGGLLNLLTSMTVGNPTGPVNLQRDYDPLSIFYGYASVVLVTKNDSEFKSIEDVVSYAKKKPGELVCGTSQVGTTFYLNAMLLNRYAKIDITILPLRGSSEITPQVLGGHIQLGYLSDVAARSYISANRMRPLAVDIKSSVVDVPTFGDKGYKDINLVSSIGIFGPKGMPAPVLQTWENTLNAIMKDPKFIDAATKMGYNLNPVIEPGKLNKLVKDEIEKYSRFTPEELGWKKK